MLATYGYRACCVSAAVLAAQLASAAEFAFPGKSWDEVAPAAEQLDAAKLATATAYLKENSGKDGVRELVIIRRGKLVWKGDNIDHKHGIWSCTKSFTSTVLGMLIEDGKCTLDTPAREYVPELADKFSGVTLRHLATMTSGYRAAGDEPKGTYRHGPSSTPFLPGPEPLFAPGKKYAYWDSAMNLFGLVLTRIAGEPLEVYFKRRIADPIGMDEAAWDWGDYAKDHGLVVNGGSGNGSKHIFITAREFARFGHLYLNGGNWNGKQLIRRAWIEQATAIQVPATLPWAQPESEIDGRGVYGFNWWRNGLRADGRRLWPGVPASAYAASGHNNNELFVIPEWEMVVVRMGLDQADVKVRDEVWGEFLRRVGEARTDAGGEEEARAK
jgi:CubicO group peptidase (beta-lactamase class C family)